MADTNNDTTTLLPNLAHCDTGNTELPAETENVREGVPVTTKRRSWFTPERSTLFVESMPMVEALAAGTAAGVERVFIAGKPETPGRAVAAAGDGVRVFADGHYPVMSYGGVSVYYLAQWFGENIEAADGLAVFDALQSDLRRVWRVNRITVLANPSATGLDLWARTIRGQEWPVMPAGWRDTVRRHGGQGRIEMFAPPENPGRSATVGMPVPVGVGPVVLHEYDMRLAYLSGLRRLPIGVPVAVADQTDEYAAGRYRVRWAAPAGWARAGILPLAADDGGTWSWPAAGTGWVSGEELHLARRHGWTVDVMQGFEWPGRAEPMRLWAERLTGLYEAYAGREIELATAVRAIMLHTIGALHGAPRKVTVSGHEPPANARGVRARTDTGGFTWHEMRPARNETLAHPEWSTTIWARARARLVDDGKGCGLVHVPAGRLVAARTDAFYTAGPLPVAPVDTGRPGSYRLKSVTFADSWPATSTELLAAKGR